VCIIVHYTTQHRTVLNLSKPPENIKVQTVYIGEEDRLASHYMSWARRPMKSATHGRCNARRTFPVAERHRLLIDAKLYCLVIGTEGCEQLAHSHSRYEAAPWWAVVEPDCKSNPMRYSRQDIWLHISVYLSYIWNHCRVEPLKSAEP